MRNILLLTFFCALMVLAGCEPEPVASGEALVKKMHEEYNDSWYDYLTFEQETIFYKAGEVERSQTWYEALAAPGRLVIKFDSLDSGNGVIFRQDTQYVFQQNKLVQQAPRIHDLLVLGFDVYKQDPAETVRKLEARGYDLGKIYESEWQGRPAYVVGAAGADDSTSNQFWIDKERLYFVRLLRANAQTGSVDETLFNNYEQAGGGWVAPEVLFYRDGELMLRERYSNIKVRDTMKASIFDLRDFEGASW